MLFECARLEIAAIKNGVIAELTAMFELVRLQLHHHRFSFFFVVPADSDADWVAVAEIGPQLFLEQFFVMRNQRVGGFENAHG